MEFSPIKETKTCLVIFINISNAIAHTKYSQMESKYSKIEAANLKKEMRAYSFVLSSTS